MGGPKKPDDDLRLAVPDEAPEGPMLVVSNVTRLRTQRGWSDAKLAEKAGLREEELQRILGGTEMPPVEILWKLSRALAVPVATLLRPLRRGL